MEDPSPRWLVLYLVVVRGFACLCDPESDVCREIKLLAGLTKQIRSKGRDQTEVGQTRLSRGTPTTGLALRKVATLSRASTYYSEKSREKNKTKPCIALYFGLQDS
jgi:hypothetical protein